MRKSGGVTASVMANCQENLMIRKTFTALPQPEKEKLPPAQTGGQTLGKESKKAIICQSCESGMIPLAGMPARVLSGQYNQRSERAVASPGRQRTSRDWTAV